MRKFFLIIAFFSFILPLFSQKTGELIFSGRITDANTKQRLTGVKVTLYKDGSPTGSMVTSSSSKYELKGPPGHLYKLMFEKEGMVPKFIEIDVSRATEEEFGKYDLPFDLDMTLFDDVPGVDFSSLKSQPIGKMYWDMKEPNLIGFDSRYNDQMRTKVQKLMDEAERKRKEEEERKLAEAKKLEEFNKKMAQGNASFGSGRFEDALKAYEEAKSIMPDNPEVGTKITETQKKIKEQQEKAQEQERRKKYDELIASADKAFGSKDYAKALKDYNEALVLFPKESHPNNRIIEIDNIQKKLKEEQEAQAKKDQEYKNFITAADNLLAQKKYEDALKNYESASKVKPEEVYPKDKIKEVQELIKSAKDNEAKEQEYKNLITAADADFNAKKYGEAKGKYESALKIKPQEVHPKNRVEEINKILKEQSEKEAVDKKYQEAIKAGDLAFNAKDYAKAKMSYESAQSVKPNETYPKDKIKEIDEILKKQKEQETLEADYNKFLLEGQTKFSGKDYQGAISAYQKASELKPNEAKPKDEIEKINKILKDMEDAKATDQKYTQAMKDAKALFDKKDYEGSKSKYQEASTIKPQEKEPKDKIKEIETLLKQMKEQEAQEAKYKQLISEADSDFNAKNYQQAQSKYQEALGMKPTELHPKKKIEEIKKILDEMAAKDAASKEYNDKIAEADQQYQNKSYDLAIKKYEEASAIKPTESYPKDQVKKIREIQQNIAKQAEQEKKYQLTLAEADAKFKAKDYAGAKTKYEAALAIKADESYPKEKIEEINTLLGNLAEQEAQEKEFQKLVQEGLDLYNKKSWQPALSKYESALKLKPNDRDVTYKIEDIKKKIEEEEGKMAVEERYKKFIAEADQSFNSKNYESSITSYEKALEIKPAEKYPNDQIQKAKSLIEQQKVQAREAEYKKLIADADQKFAKESYDDAKNLYSEALKVKSDAYPENQIAKINKILTDRAKTDATLEKYQEIIAKADKALSDKDYEKSKNYYKEAANVRPDETYPQTQIDKINELMKQETQNEKQEMYEKIVQKADDLLAAKDYTAAITYYERAVSMNPNDNYPRDQIKAVKEIIKNTMLAEQNAETEKKYKDLIAKADNLFESKQWNDAKKYYGEAYSIKPEDYPQDQIDKINEMMRSERDQIMAGQYQKIIDKADELFRDESYLDSKRYYERALSLKPDDKYPRNRIDEINRIIALEEQLKKGKIVMKDYGTPVKNQSLMDGEALLLEAEAHKRFILSQRVIKQGEIMENNTRGWSDDNYDNTVDMRNLTELYRTRYLKNQESWSKSGENNELNIKDFVDLMIDINLALAKYNNDAIFRIRGMVENMYTEFENQQAEGEQTRSDNELKVVAYNDHLQNESNNKEDKMYNQIMDTRTDVEQIIEDKALQEFEGDETRSNNELRVNNYNDHLQEENNNKNDEMYDQIMSTRSDVEQIIEDKALQEFEGDETRSNNELRVNNYNDHLQEENNNKNDEMYDQIMSTRSDVEQIIEDKAQQEFEGDFTRSKSELQLVAYGDLLDAEQRGKDEESYNQSIDTRRSVEKINENIATMQFEGDNTRSDSELEINNTKENFDLVQQNLGKDSEDQMMKTRSDVENLIEERALAEFEGDETRKDSEMSLEKYTDGLSESRHIEAEENYDKIIDSKNKVEDIITEKEEFKVEADKLREGSSDNILNYQDRLEDDSKVKHEETENKRRNVEDKIDKIKDYSPIKHTPEMANELAQKYPEGVTEETYNLTDNDGVVNRVITRRIVVKNNRGDVYERVQTRFGLTYSKNGGAITEYVWENDTQDASLVRH